MKRAKITIVTLYTTDSMSTRWIVPYLKQAGHEVQIIYFKDYFVNDAKPHTPGEENHFISLLKQFSPDIVGISIGSSTYFRVATRLTDLIHEKIGVPVIFGGIHAMVMPEECLEWADLVCLGEGEKPMLELANALAADEDISGIKNFWLKKNGSIIRNKVRPWTENLDFLPLPDFSDDNKFLIDKDVFEGDPQKIKIGEYLTQGVRGCPFACTFCMNSILRKVSPGKYIRRRSPEHLIEELVYVRENLPQVTMICFADDVFNLDKEWMHNFARLYKKQINLPFFALTTPQLLDDDTLKTLKDAGLYLIELGIQSGSERIRFDIFNRKSTNEDILHAASRALRFGMDLKFDLICDNPFETEEDKREALDLLLRLPKPFQFSIFSMVWFPGAPITKMALEEGFITENDIETYTQKSFNQWSTSLDYPRSNDELFWISIFSLTGKPWVPNGFIRFLSHRDVLRKHTGFLKFLVKINSMLVWIMMGIPALFKGYVPWKSIRKRWRHIFKAIK